MRLLPFDYAVRNLGRSPTRLLSIASGYVLVVLLIVAASAFVEGMRDSLAMRHDSGNVILLGAGSEESVERSEIPASTASILSASVPGLRTIGGETLVSSEVLSAVILNPERDAETELRVICRGITPAAFLVHPQVEITEGRAPLSGSNEILAGALAADKLGLTEERLAIGQSFWLDGTEWKIVGRMRAPGTVMNGEFWVPLTDLKVAMKRDTVSCVIVTLDTAEFADIDAFTKTRVDLELAALRESEYYASVLRFFRPVQAMIWISALLIAASAILGGLTTLYAAFASQAREIGMLQSLGFTRRAIMFSLVQESLIIACAAVILAIAIALVFIDKLAVAYSMGVLELSVSAPVMLTGALAGLGVGTLGAIPPAWRCMRMSIPESLKAS